MKKIMGKGFIETGGDKGGQEYPEHLAIHRTTRSSQEILLRPVRISDEPLIKEFFYSLSDESLYTRFISATVFLALAS